MNVSGTYNVTDNYDNMSGDTTANVTEPLILEPDVEDSPEATAVPIVFILIFLVGVIGNSTLIFTVLRNKSMRNTPNIFVVSLSFGDLLLLLFSVPFSATLYTITSWPFGEFMCNFNEYMQTLSLGISVFTLTALSGDRYIAIVHPMSKHTGKPTMITIITVIAIWLLAIVLAIPDGVTSKLEYKPTMPEPGDDMNRTSLIAICVLYPEDFPLWYTKGHSMFRFFVFFVIPLVIIGLFYILMAQILILSSRDMPCEATKNTMMNQQQKRQVQARIKVAKVVLSFVLIFIICWLPRHIFILWYNYSPDEYNMFWHVFKITSFCLTYIYSCVNPYALYFLSSQFRKYYNRYLFCCCPKFKYRALGAEPSELYK